MKIDSKYYDNENDPSAQCLQIKWGSGRACFTIKDIEGEHSNIFLNDSQIHDLVGDLEEWLAEQPENTERKK